MYSFLRLPPMHKDKPNIHVIRAVPYIAHDLGDEHAALCFAPAEDFTRETQGIGLDAHGHVFALVATYFFHFGVFGPGTDGDLVVDSLGTV
jgi:hypothetical protein